MKKHVLFVVTEDWYFTNHRLGLAKQLVEHGYKVSVITNLQQEKNKIEEAGITCFNHDFRRGNLNPFTSLLTLFYLIKIFHSLKPDIAHLVALQPVLIGSIAARIVGVPLIVGAISGLGYVFSAKKLKARIIKLIILPILKLVLTHKKNHIIVQNQQDYDYLLALKLTTDIRTHLVPGAGINLEKYQFSDQGKDVPLVLFPARLLFDKGIQEFMGAAQNLIAQGISARFAVVGDIDQKNPQSCTRDDVEKWKSDSQIEFWGWRYDMPDIFAQTQIVCLPSYHEGFPKVLLEAGASKCAIIASDIAGCRMMIKNGHNGLLVPAKNTEKLQDALSHMIKNKQQRIVFGNNAYKDIEQKFTQDIITRQVMEIYSSNIADLRPESSSKI